MQTQPTNDQFYLSLIEFLMIAKQNIMAIGGEFGLTTIQTITLLLLDDARPRPMKSFCSLYRCDASNITGIIDGLEKKKLVSRQSDRNDRRVKVIQLEESGSKIKQAIIERLAAFDGLLFDPLTAEESTQLVQIVSKIADSFDHSTTDTFVIPS
jgi:DNA-binding MarR family transcriptional regulator